MGVGIPTLLFHVRQRSIAVSETDCSVIEIWMPGSSSSGQCSQIAVSGQKGGKSRPCLNRSFVHEQWADTA